MANELKSRWEDRAFQDDVLPLLESIRSSRILSGPADLRGIVIGSEGPVEALWHSNLDSVRLRQVDLAESVISGSCAESTFESCSLENATLDRVFGPKAQFHACNFAKAKLIGNFDAAEFTDCNFAGATFSGGSAGLEYGGRRTTFLRCYFTEASFKKVEFRACRFVGCTFEGASFHGCDLRGTKFENGEPTSEQFTKCQV